MGRTKGAADKAPRKKSQRTKANVPGAAGVAGIGPGHNSKPAHNLTPDEKRQLFLSHRTSWKAHLEKQKALDEARTKLVAALKNDGFTVKQFELADQLDTLKGEAKVSGEVKDRLQVARWIGHPMGAQLDLFADTGAKPGQPAGAASADAAYDKGKQASMENRPAKPQDEGYAADSAQWNHYMAGYHEHQRELGGGIKAPADVNQSTMAQQPGAPQGDTDEIPPALQRH